VYRGHTVGVAIPAYNEEGYVGNVIDGLPAYVDRAYVVDDGSTDGTWEEIRRHAERRNSGHEGQLEECIVPVRHEENRGVGGAIKTAYLQALEEGIDIIAVLGGDDQMDVSELPRFLDPIVDGVADYTKGNRFARAEDRALIPRFRFVGNTVLSSLTRIASGYWGVMDSQNGYTAISREALERTDVEEMYEYYGYCNDLLVRLNVAGLRVADVPQPAAFVYDENWKSHIRYSEYIPRVSLMLLRSFFRRQWQNLRRGDRSPAVLYLSGAVLMATGVAGLIGSLLGSGRLRTWERGLAFGLVTFLSGALLDRRDDRVVQVSLGPWSTDDRGQGRTDDRKAMRNGSRSGEVASAGSTDTSTVTED
jgi:glycosyltransferase involved in cell wall biosynthesis